MKTETTAFSDIIKLLYFFSSLSTTEERFDCLRRVRVRAAIGGSFSLNFSFALFWLSDLFSTQYARGSAVGLCSGEKTCASFTNRGSPLLLVVPRRGYEIVFTSIGRILGLRWSRSILPFDLSRLSLSWWLVSGRRSFESPFSTAFHRCFLSTIVVGS